MRKSALSLALLWVVVFSLALWLAPALEQATDGRSRQVNLLTTVLGDSRRMFASQIYLKADAYFHNGFYPTIYDNREGFEKPHITDEVGLKQEEDEELAYNFLGKPKDWLDRFSRSFYPSRHTHLGDSGCGHSCCQRPQGEVHTHDHGPERTSASGAERELLPWLRLSAELDPERIETYVVAAYWLRTKLNKTDEAEQFLREGLRANPGNGELLFELGRVFRESRNNTDRARNIWELALAGWRKSEEGKARDEQNIFLYAQILGNLVKLEFEQKNFAKSLEYLKLLKEVSPNQAGMKKWEDDLKAAMSP